MLSFGILNLTKPKICETHTWKKDQYGNITLDFKISEAQKLTTVISFQLIETIDLSSLNDSDGYPDFGDDDDSPQRAGTTVTRMGATKKKQGWGFLSTVGEFISSSFYW